jgi:phosphatidylinositol phospholipase C, delta
MASKLSSKMSKLNPFSKRTGKEDDEEAGDVIDFTTVAGGGHAARASQVTRHELRVSKGLQAYLVSQGVLTQEDVGAEDEDHATTAVRELVNKPHVRIPPENTDRSHPLAEYFISSSHNTYLIAHQLYGSSSADAYKTALRTGSRCVEIDAWDNEDNKEEPKVTHGYTLVSHIPFRAVCETIREVVDEEAAQSTKTLEYRPAPILLSLENHCGAEGQKRLVDIMKETWGDRLLSRVVREKGHDEQQGTGDHVTLQELGSKIVLIVEYHWPDEPKTKEEAELDEVDSDEEDEEFVQARRAYNEKKKAAPSIIIPELAELGVYAQSVKPRDNSWFGEVGLKDGPHDHLINISETQLLAHLPAENAHIARANAQHMMRVYPKGTRISSNNLKPVTFWGLGAQICALNWQTFGASIQLNEALFAGSDGYVLKPAALRAGGSGKPGTDQRKMLRLHVGGATDIPVPEGRDAEDIRPYLTCTLYHPSVHDEDDHPKRKTAHYKQHKLGLVHKWASSPPTDPVWDEVLEWEYEDNELVFLRMLVKDDIAFARNPIYTVSAARLSYVAPGWNFIRMLDLKGRETRCSIAVKFEIVDV